MRFLEEDPEYEPKTRFANIDITSPAYYIFPEGHRDATRLRDAIAHKYEISTPALAETEFEYVMLDEAHTARRRYGAFFHMVDLLKWRGLL